MPIYSTFKIAKQACLVFSILDSSKTEMQERWYDYLKEKYGSKAKWCYIQDTDSFIKPFQADDLEKDIAKDPEKKVWNAKLWSRKNVRTGNSKMVWWKMN